MDLGDFIFISSIVIPGLIFEFFRNYLDKNKSWWFILGGSSIITLMGYIYVYTSNIDHKNTLYVSLIVPLYATLLYKGMTLLFVKWFGRMPEDTFLEFRVKFSDAMFNILYGILITVVPLSVTYLLY
ncbi:hypothetical protein [Aquimarina sp. I32.4]|uniref:hypothetical protein n=1 Tax=Aquimarina sp. I32.4 TaxID=2053903 RepID=UPI000CDEB2FD|nr:hypothetical protein [Aquimarina sp. I32.4]